VVNCFDANCKIAVIGYLEHIIARVFHLLDYVVLRNSAKA
jgi:hypothetical protein